MNPSWRIRPLQLSDIEAILAIQSASPEAAQWGAADYRRICAGEGTGVVVEAQARLAEGQGSVTGFLIGRAVSDEFEILNMAVRPENRREEAGSWLLAEAVEKARAAGAKTIFLEVRESNQGARAFYERHGFCVAGRRPQYYTSPAEDALVLSRTLRT